MTPDALLKAAARYERTYGCRAGDGGTADMLRAGAAAMEECERLRECLAMASCALDGTVRNMAGDEVFRFGPGYRSLRWLKEYIAALQETRNDG